MSPVMQEVVPAELCKARSLREACYLGGPRKHSHGPDYRSFTDRRSRREDNEWMGKKWLEHDVD